MASAQSWREPGVRRWMALALGLLVVILGVGAKTIATGLYERQLFSSGVRLQGKIDVISGGRRNMDRTVPREITLSFLMPGETERRVLEKQQLEADPNAPAISWGDTLEILVDPHDPRKWTSQLQPASWLVVLAVPLLLVPVMVLFALVTMAARRRIVRLYENGVVAQATVSEAHRSALLPGQKAVKLDVAGNTLTAAYPDLLGPIHAGDGVDVIVDSTQDPSHAIVVGAYS